MLNGVWVGHKSAPVIVFLHGGGLTGQSLHPVAERLTEYRCHLPDLPGHGLSRSESFRDLALTADAVVDQIEGSTSEPIHLFGLSFGGFVALYMLAKRPNLAASAVISGVHPGTIQHKRLLNLALWATYPAMSIRILREMSARMVGIDDVGRMSDAMGRAHADAATIRDVGLAALNFNCADLAGPIPTRALLLAGQNEISAVVRGLNGFSGVFRKKCTASVDGGGHGWCMQDPDLAAAAIKAWTQGSRLVAGLRQMTFDPVG